ncbi:MAG: ABC transporter permease [Ornithinimicrobium sp.]
MIAIVVAAVSVVALLVIAFTGAATQSAPRDLPIAVTGGERAAGPVADELDRQIPGGFEVTAVMDRSDAAALIQEREAYGALVTQGPQVREILVASAASPAVSTLLTDLGAGLDVGHVTDVAPAPAEDPRGAGLASGALPITIGGILTGSLVAFLVSGRRRQLGSVAGLALLMGTTIVTVLHGGYEALTGPVWLEIAVVSAGVGAIGLTLTGLNAALGRGGLIAGDLMLILLGNPFSAASSAPELLPTPWGQIGHWMPLGSTVDLLRGVSGFDGAATAAPWLALALWAGLGVALLALPERWTLPHLRHRSPDSAGTRLATASSGGR